MSTGGVILKEAAVDDLQRLMAKLQREGYMSEYALSKLTSAITDAGVRAADECGAVSASGLTDERIVSIFYPMGTATENQKLIARAIGRAIERVVLQAPGSDYLFGYADALDHAAFYVLDHCRDGDEHAAIVRELKRPDGAQVISRFVLAGWRAAMKCHSERGMAGWSSHREEYLSAALAATRNAQGEQR